jgi:hypothetical protein
MALYNKHMNDRKCFGIPYTFLSLCISGFGEQCERTRVFGEYDGCLRLDKQSGETLLKLPMVCSLGVSSTICAFNRKNAKYLVPYCTIRTMESFCTTLGH